ncbi:hypothetical protein DFH09DRAFT_1355859 [Mycena vulgaris]|nr:hypothetical protein DFH09DRAFT_1355859 [Mycena vulgaris]
MGRKGIFDFPDGVERKRERKWEAGVRHRVSSRRAGTYPTRHRYVSSSFFASHLPAHAVVSNTLSGESSTYLPYLSPPGFVLLLGFAFLLEPPPSSPRTCRLRAHLKAPRRLSIPRATPTGAGLPDADFSGNGSGSGSELGVGADRAPHDAIAARGRQVVDGYDVPYPIWVSRASGRRTSRLHDRLQGHGSPVTALLAWSFTDPRGTEAPLTDREEQHAIPEYDAHLAPRVLSLERSASEPPRCFSPLCIESPLPFAAHPLSSPSIGALAVPCTGACAYPILLLPQHLHPLAPPPPPQIISTKASTPSVPTDFRPPSPPLELPSLRSRYGRTQRTVTILLHGRLIVAPHAAFPASSGEQRQQRRAPQQHEGVQLSGPPAHLAPESRHLPPRCPARTLVTASSPLRTAPALVLPSLIPRGAVRKDDARYFRSDGRETQRVLDPVGTLSLPMGYATYAAAEEQSWNKYYVSPACATPARFPAYHRPPVHELSVPFLAPAAGPNTPLRACPSYLSVLYRGEARPCEDGAGIDAGGLLIRLRPSLALAPIRDE